MKKISYILAGSELVKAYIEEELIDVANHINKNDGTIIEYDHSKPIGELLNQLNGYMDFCDIAEEEATEIKSHLK